MKSSPESCRPSKMRSVCQRSPGARQWASDRLPPFAKVRPELSGDELALGEERTEGIAVNSSMRLIVHTAVIVIAVIAAAIGVRPTGASVSSTPVAASAPESMVVADRTVLIPASTGSGASMASVPLTMDTDLTQPSRETAASIDKVLAGTALAGTGQAFFTAELRYKVNAKYLAAHAIEESRWGTSTLAQQKHNLFGYGADDINPFADAITFPSFADCIDTVAAHIARDYLSNDGRYFHGPTLRGMSMVYASDERWARNIVEIARALP